MGTRSSIIRVKFFVIGDARRSNWPIDNQKEKKNVNKKGNERNVRVLWCPHFFFFFSLNSFKIELCFGWRYEGNPFSILLSIERKIEEERTRTFNRGKFSLSLTTYSLSFFLFYNREFRKAMSVGTFLENPM